MKLVKVGGRLVRHARRLVFQLAEAAVPREVTPGTDVAVVLTVGSDREAVLGEGAFLKPGMWSRRGLDRSSVRKTVVEAATKRSLTRDGGGAIMLFPGSGDPWAVTRLIWGIPA